MADQTADDTTAEAAASGAENPPSSTTSDHPVSTTTSSTADASTNSSSHRVFDTVTGEYVSKNELKRRQKAREKVVKAGRATDLSGALPGARRRPELSTTEEQLSPHQYFEIRTRNIRRMQETDGVNPWPHKFQVTYDMEKFVGEFQHLTKGEEVKDKVINVACRIMAIRSAGDNLRFYEVDAGGVEIQVMATNLNSTSKTAFIAQHEHLRRGDHIGITGFPGRTSPKAVDKPGELSILAQEVVLLAPCLHQIPSGHFGLKDQEERYRNRPLDMLLNKPVIRTFVIRSQIIKYIREYLDSRRFIEVETPILMTSAGGAAAKPFITEHIQAKRSLYLRIATELPLKQLIIGGMGRVYEIGRQFRNEGSDPTHNPEFTTCECYEAFADMYDTMDRMEELVSGMVMKVRGSLHTEYTTSTGEHYNVDWAKPWKRIQMIPALEEACGEKFPSPDQLHTDESNKFLKRMLEQTGVGCSPPLTNARMLDALTARFIEEKCINPTFVVGHPMVMSPLAKTDRNTPGLTERFEIFVCKKEIVNAYTELNDPFEQRRRFEEQARQKSQGDEEAQVLDEPFLHAMEYGLPPTAGWGMGIDRMVMFLANCQSIKDVITFPYMKEDSQ